jgi:hypothetical protein
VARCRLHGVELGADLLDLLADQPPVGLQLALARSPRADPAAGARQVGPHPRQARQVVLERGELDLEPPLARLGVAREDVDDQRRSVEHLAVEQLLQAALLVRIELVVDDEHVEVAPPSRRRARRPGPCRSTTPGRARTGAGRRCRRRSLRPSRPGRRARRASGAPASGHAGVVETDEEGALDRGGEVDQAGAFGHAFEPW